MARWVVGSILHCGPIELFLFQPVLHDRYNKGHGVSNCMVGAATCGPTHNLHWLHLTCQSSCHFIFQGVRNPAEDSITVSPTAWWVGLHVGVPHSQGLCRRPCPAHIWWQQRDHERTHSETNHF